MKDKLKSILAEPPKVRLEFIVLKPIIDNKPKRVSKVIDYYGNTSGAGYEPFPKRIRAYIREDEYILRSWA